MWRIKVKREHRQWATDPPGGNTTKWHHDEPTCEILNEGALEDIKLLERRDDNNDHGKGWTTRTDENSHYYYFTERGLTHMNLTRVGMRAGDFPYEDFTNGKDGRRGRERMIMHTTITSLKVSHHTQISHGSEWGCTRHPWTGNSKPQPNHNATSVCNERQPPQFTASLVWKRTQERGLLWVAK
jgi:hypothetical protein